jgi:hypothetical protein
VTALFDRDPVGQQIRVAAPPTAPTVTVVGVVGDIKGEGLEVPNTRGTVYLPAAQLHQVGFFSPKALAIRTTSNPVALAPAVQREIWAINPNQTIAKRPHARDHCRRTDLDPEGADRALLDILRAGALHGGARRLRPALVRRDVATREIGVRTAMGAQRWDLVTLIMRDSVVSVGFGLAGGVVLAVIVSRSMSSLIYGVEPLDVISLATSTGVLGAVAGIAALLRVWRATRIDPMTALRAE